MAADMLAADVTAFSQLALRQQRVHTLPSFTVSLTDGVQPALQTLPTPAPSPPDATASSSMAALTNSAMSLPEVR